MNKIMKYFKPYIVHIIFIVLFITGQVYLELKLPEYLSEILGIIIGKSNEKMSEMFPIMLSIVIAAGICSIISIFLSAKVGAGVSRDLRKKIYDSVQDFSMEEINSFSTSSLITRSTNDIQQVQMVLIMILRFAVMSPVMAAIAIFKAVNVSTNLTWLIALGVISLLSVIAVIFIMVMPKFKKMQKLNDSLNLVTRENLTGIRVVRAYNAEEYETKKFNEINENVTKTHLFVNRVTGIMSPIMMLIMYGLQILILYVGAKLINKGSFADPQNLSQFVQYAMQIVMSFMFITMIFIMIPRGSVSANRIAEVLEKKTKIHDPKESKNSAARGEIEFKDVSFKYPDASEAVIENISFKVLPGEVVAFIGSTGSGKSTLINLIPRFYDVTSGEILVDGIDVRDYKQYDLRKKIGYVPQKGVLFSGTVSSNIAFGQEEVDVSMMIKAAKIAQASEFIEQSEGGYDHPISQGGINVSGGQKQRLSIARAIMKNPKIYIFDDSFSALDFKTDKELRKNLAQETEGATCLIVAQRIGTIMNADKIVVLDEGRIVGMGTHKELLKNCRIYNEIASSQLSKEEM